MKKQDFLNGNVSIKLGRKTRQISKKVIAIVLVVILVLGGGTYYFARQGSDTEAELITALVTRGDIISSIEGTGVIEAINQYEVTSLAKGDIIADYFEEGDYVEKDQLLYQMDSSSATSSIERAKSSMEKAQMSYDQAAEDVANLNVKADISGVITELNVKKGGQVSNNSVVAKIVDSENMLLRIPFNAEDAKQLRNGQIASVILENSMTTVRGTISRIATGSTVNSYGVAVTNVELLIKNPGSILPGDRATVIAGDYACNDAGTFEYKNETTVNAKVSGKAIAVNYQEGDKISAGSVIVRLESDSTTSSARSSRLSLNDARQSLSDAQEELEDYKIKAPISGKVIEKNAKAGEKLDQNSSSTMAIIADLSSLVFEMNIDELDINKIEVGQTVEVTADAIENKTFAGTVTSISIVGTSSQGVTSYPVKVTIDNIDESGLIPGMNVTGNIVVESVTDVLRVPVSAVRRGNLVIVKDEDVKNINTERESGGDINQSEKPQMPEGDMPQGERPQMPEGNMPQGEKISSASGWLLTTAYAQTSSGDVSEKELNTKRLENMKKQLDVPDGYTVVQVDTGLSNDSFIEIKSGLAEGQTVLLPDATGRDTTNQTAMIGGMPGGGMPGGGMPGGGMPGGGMPGGGMPGGMSGGMSGARR